MASDNVGAFWTLIESQDCKQDMMELYAADRMSRKLHKQASNSASRNSTACTWRHRWSLIAATRNMTSATLET